MLGNIGKELVGWLVAVVSVLIAVVVFVVWNIGLVYFSQHHGMLAGVMYMVLTFIVIYIRDGIE